MQSYDKSNAGSYEKFEIDENAAETCDLTYNFMKNIKRRAISTNPLTNGTASGGILQITQSFTKSKEQLISHFEMNSNFYNENPINSKLEEDDNSVHIIYDTSLETIGCCRSKFFCF